MISFSAIGDPVGQPRPKARAIPLTANGKPVFKNGKRMWTAQVYDPGTADEWKACVIAAARRHKPPQPLEGPLQVDITFHMPRPLSHFGTGRNAGLLKANAPTWHTFAPDADNLLKAVLDALTQLGMWHDDSQVAQTSVVKRYGHRSGADITITPLVAEELMLVSSGSATTAKETSESVRSEHP